MTPSPSTLPTIPYIYNLAILAMWSRWLELKAAKMATGQVFRLATLADRLRVALRLTLTPNSR